MPRITAPGVIPEVDLWRAAITRPSSAATPFLAIAEALLADGAPAADAGGFGPALPEIRTRTALTTPQLSDVLAQGDEAAVATILNALTSVGDAEQGRGDYSRAVRADLLLMVDQLEEIFAEDVSTAFRTAFAGLLTALVATGRVWVIATLRADLYARLISDADFLALKESGGQCDLASPGEADLSEIIKRSAAAAGLIYERDPATGEALGDRLLREAAGADALPLLQFLLKQLFERRVVTAAASKRETRLTFAGFNELGGLDGAIDHVAETALRAPENGLRSGDAEAGLPRLIRALAGRVRDQRDPGASQALTIKTVQTDQFSSDPAMLRLIEVLVRARLLVSGSTESGFQFVRIAHERVLTSWSRAKDVVRDNVDFFRVMADVESQLNRWNEGGRKREFLLPAGTQVDDAERLARNYRAELSSTLRDFITLSIRRARWRQRRAAAAATVFCGLAVIATILFVLAGSAQQRAERDYGAAKQAADRLVTSVAEKLRDLVGVKAETLDVVFGVVGGLIDNIQSATAEKPGPVERAGQTLMNGLAWLGGSAAVPSRHNEELEQSRANMLYQFGETYHGAQVDPKKAESLATESAAIFQHLLDSGHHSLGVRAGLASSHMLIGDLKSAMAGNTANADLSVLELHYGMALTIDRELLALAPDDPVRNRDYAAILTRLGDLAVNNHDDRQADDLHAEAQRYGLRAFGLAPNDLTGGRELGWSYRKVGEAYLRKHEISKAIDTFDQEVCIRRRLTQQKPSNSLLRRDLGFSLIKAGDARAALVPPDLIGAKDNYYEAITVRHALQAGDPGNPGWVREYAAGLEKAVQLQWASNDPKLALDFAIVASDVRQHLPPAAPAAPRPESILEKAERLANAAEPPPLADARDNVNEQLYYLTSVNRSTDACWSALLKTTAKVIGSDQRGPAGIQPAGIQ